MPRRLIHLPAVTEKKQEKPVVVEQQLLNDTSQLQSAMLIQEERDALSNKKQALLDNLEEAIQKAILNEYGMDMDSTISNEMNRIGRSAYIDRLKEEFQKQIQEIDAQLNASVRPIQKLSIPTQPREAEAKKQAALQTNQPKKENKKVEEAAVVKQEEKKPSAKVAKKVEKKTVPAISGKTIPTEIACLPARQASLPTVARKDK